MRFVPFVAVCALLLLGASTVAADTIYLKNGRALRTSSVRIEGERVVFVQYGGTVSIPMALVDRIEEDEAIGPEATPTAPPGPEAVETAPEAAGAEGAEGAEEGETPPEQTREYWQDRLRTIATERQQLETQLEELRRQERAFLFSQRSTAETRTQIEAVQARLAELVDEEAALREEGRRLGVPAGWLRLGPGSEAIGGSRGSG